ncbi:MAG: mannonate dehydratase [Proteobacteria bacterium]|nr:mannonate dehydratase [Pseudomonadota bacterium]
MARRDFLRLSGAVGAAGAVGTAVGAATVVGVSPAAAATASHEGRPHGLKLGCQSGPSNAQHFAFLARYGVRNICGSPGISDPARLCPTVSELVQLRELAGKYGISVDMTDSVLLQSSLVDQEAHPAIVLGDSPQRDRDIEDFQNLIRNCARAGIPAVKYNMSILGVLRNLQAQGRGDALYSGWDLSKAPPDEPRTRAGVVDADTFWERITYFLERVVPVADEYRIRIACHPQDPGVPARGYRGVNRVLGTVDGLKRFISIHESPWHGLNFCQGTISEDLADPAREIFDVIRYFGTRRKIFNVHFRNIRGHRDRFVETFPDEGDVDMLRAVLTYKQVGYEGMLMPDHVPLVEVPRNGAAPAPNHRGGAAADGHLESFAFAYGYIRGLLQAVDRIR